MIAISNTSLDAMHPSVEKQLNKWKVALSAIPMLLTVLGFFYLWLHILHFNLPFENIWIFVLALFVSVYLSLQDSRTVASKNFQINYNSKVSAQKGMRIRLKIFEKGKSATKATIEVYKMFFLGC